VVVTDPPGGSAGGAPDAAGAPPSGPGRAANPPATGTSGKAPKAGDAQTGAAPQDPTQAAPFDASGLSGLLGVGQAVVPASDSAALAAPGSAPAGLEAALASHQDHSGSAVLLGLTMLILIGLAGGAGVRWWAGRPGRYWPA
jgi:hypothetical protein